MGVGEKKKRGGRVGKTTARTGHKKKKTWGVHPKKEPSNRIVNQNWSKKQKKKKKKNGQREKF